MVNYGTSEEKIFYFDSLQNPKYNTSDADYINKFLSAAQSHQLRQHKDIKVAVVPKQNNTNDWGVYLLPYIEKLLPIVEKIKKSVRK